MGMIIRFLVFSVIRRIIGWPGIILIGGMLYLYFTNDSGSLPQ